MAYKKPQDPLTNNGFGIYPLTTADQVILSDGSRLEKNGAINLVTLPTTEETPGEAPTINAGTFGGMTVSQFVEMIYPVGSIYMSANATSPETLFGGTWTPINGRFLISTGTPENNDDGTSPGNYNYAAGSTGGEAQSKIKNSNLPNTITLRYSHASGGPGGGGLLASAVYTAGEVSGYAAVGTGQPNESFSNIPPYLAVYMWQRTA